MRLLTLCTLLLALILPTGFAFAHDDIEVPCTGLLILDAYVRPTVTQTGAAYGIIVNLGEEDATLLGGQTDLAAAVEIHEMTMTDGVMSMNPLPDGLPIEHLAAAALEPGGYHIMLIGITEEIAVDSTVDVTLNVEGLDEPVSLSLPVLEVGEMQMGDAVATEEAMAMGEHEEMASLIAPMGGLNVGLGDCADLDLEGVEWSVSIHEEMLVLSLTLGEDTYELPLNSLVHGSMTMDME